MKKGFISLLVITLLVIQPFSVKALSSSEAKEAWYNAKQVSKESQAANRKANIEWASDKTEENNQKVIDTGKEALHAALNEAEAWLIWRKSEVIENPEIPEDLKNNIINDVDDNLGKIDELHKDVDEIENRLQLGFVFIKMVGKYLELLADVARNTGLIWVHIAETHATTIREYEAQLREAAESIKDNEEILENLDMALEELENANINIDEAESEYLQVVIPGTPILKFANGNQYLRIAKNNLLAAHSHLKQAYLLLVEVS